MLSPPLCLLVQTVNTLVDTIEAVLTVHTEGASLGGMNLWASRRPLHTYPDSCSRRELDLLKDLADMAGSRFAVPAERPLQSQFQGIEL